MRELKEMLYDGRGILLAHIIGIILLCIAIYLSGVPTSLGGME